MSRSNTPGRMATEPLLNMESTKAAKLSQYHAQRLDRLGGPDVVWCARDPPAGMAPPFPRVLAAGLSDPNSCFRYKRTDRRKKRRDSVFLRCAIQATDSTFTG